MLNKLTTLGIMVLFLAACEDKKMDTMENSSFRITIENISETKIYSASGVFNTPVGASAPAPIFPGEAYEVDFSAAPGSRLSFATMFVQSNDLFYAPNGDGIALFDDQGNQVTGDITAQVMLWDSGTEANQEPGLGSDQAPRQSGADMGALDQNTNVRLANDDFNNLPLVSDVISVSLTGNSGTDFTLRIENVSTASTLMTSDGASHAVPLAPGVYVIHSTSNVLFTAGMDDNGSGLEAIAEDGNPGALAAILADVTGITQLIAPGVYVVHNSTNPLFTVNSSDYGEGLEALAEDGNPVDLAEELTGNSIYGDAGAFNTPVGSSSPAPVGPGGSYEFTIMAGEGGYLSLATMMVQSNDLFFAPGSMGIALYDGASPVSGDITDKLSIWDAGTEINERPGFGLNQAPRQSSANQGADEMGLVRTVNDMYSYPTVDEIIRVTILPL